ncbi:hypothetical protein KCU98_g4815, partial [Aureobasidium melanogenum]
MRFWKDHPKEIEAGGDFPPPFRPAVAAAAWPPKAQDTTEPQKGSEESDEPGREITGQVDKKGRPIVPKSALAPTKSDRSTASRSPRAEPITSHLAAGWGVGGFGGGFVPPRRPKPPGEGEHRREADSSGTNRALGDAPMFSRGHYHRQPRAREEKGTQSRGTAHRASASEWSQKPLLRRHHHNNITSTSRPAQSQVSFLTSPQLFLQPSPRNTAIMFSIGPPSSSSSSSPSSRDVSPSKGSEWSTTSEPLTKPKTPKKRASSTSSSEAYWSDDSDTPVKPRVLRRSGRVLSKDSFGARSLLSTSDPRSEAGSRESIYASSVYSDVDSEDQAQSAAPNAEGQFQSADPNAEDAFEDPFPNPETWESQHDTRNIDPLKLGEIPVRSLPLIAIHSTFQHSREAWGLPPLKLRCPMDSHRHPYHIYQWNTKKLNCYAEHESDCQLCGASCCSVMAYTKAINEDPRPNPVVPLKYRMAFQRDIDQINAMKPQATDPFERMLKCDTCYRNVCPDCAGRCMKPACLRIICKSCGDPDPWRHCQCEMYEGKLRITYI